MPTKLTLLTAILLTPALHANPGDPKPRTLTLQMEKLSGPLLPLQAIHLRLTLHNAGKEPLAPLDFLGGDHRLLLKGPNDATFRALAHIFPEVLDSPPTPTTWQIMAERAPLRLEPGERISVSFAVAAEWTPRKTTEGNKEIRTNHADFLFPEPGKYALKYTNRIQDTSFEQTLEFEVSAPNKTDAQVLQLLKKDAFLSSALLHPLDTPRENLLPKFKHLIERFPNSSYTDYARFALARSYVRYQGVHPPSQRVSYALAADQLDKVAQNRFVEDRLVPNPFAYLPEALLLFQATDPIAKNDVLRRLDRAYPDALPWLQVMASSLMAANSESMQFVESVLNRKFHGHADDITSAWRTYRKRQPGPDIEDRPLP